MEESESLPLPKSWRRSAKRAVLEAMSISAAAFNLNLGRWFDNPQPQARQDAELERLRVDNELLKEQLRIKDARLAGKKPGSGPHYLQPDRMAILELRAQRGWTQAETARRFHVHPKTVGIWMGTLEDEGEKALTRIPEPVNKLPAFVGYLVRKLKTVAPESGRKRIAQLLARETLHVSPSTVRRRLKEPQATPPPKPEEERIILDEPKALILLTEDLPEDGKYFISQDKGSISNEMIVYEFTQHVGEKTAELVDLYLQETSRLDGYSLVWTRGSWTFNGPLYIANEIAIFETTKGAELEVTKYKPLLINAMDGRVPSHQDVQIGDFTRIYMDTVISNGLEADVILVEFSYRNVVIDIGCLGEKGKYTLDDVLLIAENVYQRLLELPLGEL